MVDYVKKTHSLCPHYTTLPCLCLFCTPTSFSSLSAIVDAELISKQFATSVWNCSYLSLPLESGFYYTALHYSVSLRDRSLWISAFFHTSPWSPAACRWCMRRSDLVLWTLLRLEGKGERVSSKLCVYLLKHQSRTHQKYGCKLSSHSTILFFQKDRMGL